MLGAEIRAAPHTSPPTSSCVRTDPAYMRDMVGGALNIEDLVWVSFIAENVLDLSKSY